MTRPDPTATHHHSSPACFRLSGLALAVMAALPAPAHAVEKDAGETRISAGRIEGQDEVELRAIEGVKVERSGAVLTSEQIKMDLGTNNVDADGDVLLVRDQDRIKGPHARVNVDTWFGVVESPEYALRRTARARSAKMFANSLQRGVAGSGTADKIYLEGENQYRLTNATFSSCKAPNPAWYLKLGELRLDYDREKGQGNNAVVVFKGVPIVYTPWLEFPLNGGRQSGVLPPTFGSSSNTGIDLTLPYYFNLAPNYDFTLAPRYMSRRGLQVASEARYLTATSGGTIRNEFLADDLVTKTSRSLFMFTHNQSFGSGLTGAIDFNAVSDKTYFTDLSSRITSTSLTNLNRQATLNYNNGSWLSGTMLVQSFQTLSGDTPYERSPQISFLPQVADFHGFALQMPVQYTNFTHPSADTGQRTIMYPQISLPMRSAAYYLTPKIGLHLTNYDIDRRTTTGDSHLQRAVPIATLDTGVKFEREFQIGDATHIQTLEPRLYYVRAAYRDQSNYPVFDTAAADFNFAQIFSENIYSGQDRIVNANQITAGVQSRLIKADTGEQWLGMALAQRYYMADQRVTLPNETARTGRVADILAAVSGKAYRNVLLDAAVQYDPRAGLFEQTSFGVRYQPGYGKTVSFAYRFKRNDTLNGYRDIDITFQWPLWGSWYGVGRYNPNLQDHKLTEALAGVEYKADCWVFRGVWQTLLNTTGLRNNSYFFQIELNDFAGIGTNPVGLLRRNVSGYGKINEAPIGSEVFSDEQ
ncbi:LPS-assembly protein LptD [Uliginosibacterium gangwonense]|uniref:LPS-assembly protein LptD n=1 Tax=Uliginosibacterium gangwonense TaxID=392736 RepID=UPI0012FAB63A|nr:LPS-assembly protein LptD [Uliginosibacterium gangwonense]